jgi:hypothetical protein
MASASPRIGFGEILFNVSESEFDRESSATRKAVARGHKKSPDFDEIGAS